MGKLLRNIVVVIFLFLIVFAVVTFFGVNNAAKNMKVENVDIKKVEDGTYEGEARLDPVLVVLDVTVKSGKIEAINIKEHRNGLGGKAEKPVIDNIIKSQTINVDTVSGATISSKTIMKAVEQALIKKEKIN